MPNDGKSSIKPLTLLNKNARIFFIERIPSLALLLFFHIFSSKLSSSGIGRKIRNLRKSPSLRTTGRNEKKN
jgi:hypothetical protein